MDEQSPVGARLTALAEFDRAHRRAFLQEMYRILGRRSPDLLPFEEVRNRLRLRNRAYRGLQDVSLDKIVGSLGRYEDFTRTFLPRRASDRERWARVGELVQSGGGLPPVELYKVGDAYFVKDGNHRVSVARANEAPTIQAHVWEYPTRVPLTPDVNVDDLVIKQEYLDFLERTQLDQLRPDQRIECTNPGSYRELEEHIDVHRYFLGLERQAEVPYPEAVISWYDNVYQPAVRAIRRHQVLKAFPGRTEADLYLWVMRHLYFLRERYGPLVDAEMAAEDLAQRHPEEPMRRLVQSLRRKVQQVVEPGEPSEVVERLLDKLEQVEDQQESAAGTEGQA